jgi:hypothetical protein
LVDLIHQGLRNGNFSDKGETNDNRELERGRTEESSKNYDRG